MNTRETINSINKDVEFVKSLAAMKDIEQVYNALKERGLTDSFEDFKKVADEMSQEASKLSPADIDAIVGGMSTAGYDATVVGICLSAGGGLAVAF